jgi:hypothetical protein
MNGDKNFLEEMPINLEMSGETYNLVSVPMGIGR